MMRLGLDVGSRTTALVRYNGGLEEAVVIATGVRPLERCRELVGSGDGRLMVTGYGRHLVAPVLGGEVVSEISAAAAGVRHLFPGEVTVIDIGGQDSKVIALSAEGQVARFEMNDRCAAGTGRFLEVMADTLGVGIDEFGEIALSAERELPLNSQCTVFAESEVVSLIARGEDPATIALSLHRAVANRVIGMARRVGVGDKVVFIGGVARNPCIRRLLAERLGVGVTVPDDPQIIAALGAALLLKEGDTA